MSNDKEKEEGAAKIMFEKLLPSKYEMIDLFKESFVIFRPKSFIGGDFYMVRTTIEDSGNDEVYKFIILIDCTGHGIEGGMAAAITQQLIAVEFQKDIRSPKTILKRVHKSLLDMHGGDISADILILRYSKKHSSITFSGAMRPLLKVDTMGLNIIKGCRVRIGDDNYDITKLKEHEIKIEPSDTIYVSSDGYESQFGGEDGKKMMRSRMHLWLFAASTKEMLTQKEYLSTQLDKWMGDNEQVDDICLIGFKI